MHRHSGPAPFGFAWKGDKLSLVDQEARIRKLAFDLYLESRSFGAVAKRLNQLGHETRRGCKWRDVTVQRLLVCSSARGLYPVNKTTVNADGEPIEKPQDEWDYVECPPIVSDELWERVQAALVDIAPPTTTATSSPFTGLLYCRCGARMNAASSSPKFACAQCGNRTPIADLESAFLEEITTFLRKRKDTAAKIIGGDPGVIEQRELLRRSEKQIQDIEDEMRKTERLYSGGTISLARFEKMYRPKNDELRAAQRELGKVKAKIKRFEEKAGAGGAGPVFDPTTLRKQWPQIPLAAQREVVRTFVTRITIAEDEIEFSFLLSDSSQGPAKRQ